MDSIGTCPICLIDITAADEAFVEPCLHHFCFQCIQAWVKSQQNQPSPVTCPVCKTSFDCIIYDCHDVAYRIWRIDGSTTAAAGKHFDTGFGLNPEQRRRRSLYLTSLTHTKEENPIDEAEQTLERQFLEGNKYITLSGLGRPAVAQWLQREVQALLLQENVDLLCQHIIGNLKHGIETSSVENKRVTKPGRLNSEAAVEIVAAAMAPYLPVHARRLGQEFVGFILSGLNVDAHDALVFRIEAEEELESEENEAGEEEVQSNCRKGPFENNADSAVAIPLVPGLPLLSQRISIDDELIRYRPQGLLPSKGYEVRISAPATIPASIHLWLEPAGSPFSTARRQSRKLLNAEKIMFKTGVNGGILYQGKEYPSMDVVFQAKKWALSRDGPDKGSKVLLFDVVLEQNVLGIPISALPLVITAVAAVVICVGVLPWWAGTAAPELVRWVVAGAKGGRRKTRTRK